MPKMVECHECNEEIDSEDVVVVRMGRKSLKLCTECAEEHEANVELASEAEAAMQGMMEYKGR